MSYKNIQHQLQPLIQQLQRSNYEFREDFPNTIRQNQETLINRAKGIHRLRIEPTHEVKLTRFKSLIKE